MESTIKMEKKMMQQAIDFREESEALFRLVDPLKEAELESRTQFKGWTINDVVGHLHIWNWAADLSLKDGDGFQAFFKDFVEVVLSEGMRTAEEKWLDGLKNRELLDTWRRFYLETSERFAAADPRARVPWAGPDMSVRSSITARFMETWAHGQEVYDQMGVVRSNTDRIKNIVVLGVNAYNWSFSVHSMEVPGPMPFLRLTAPSGELWEWGDVSKENLIQGSAEEFCQVITQVRNIGDTCLEVAGNTATQWMASAQCFAGPPETPPPVGTRFTVR